MTRTLASSSRSFGEKLASLARRFPNALVFVTVFGLYAMTSARTVTGEDSGELIAAAFTSGVAHPPGYPLWTMLAKLATLVPIGEVALRVALLSALFGALTAVMLAAIVRVLFHFHLAAFIAALAYSTLRDPWSQSVIAEVYTLGTFLGAAAFYFVVRWHRERSRRDLAFAALMLGLGLSNHYTILATIAGCGVLLLLTAPRLLGSPRLLLSCFAMLVIGLLPYAYLPIAARANPPVNWGNPDTFERFTDHVLRTQYRVREEAKPRTYDRFKAQTSVMFQHAKEQGASLIMFMGCLGVSVLLFRRPPLGVMLGTTALASTFGVILYTNFDVDFENVHANRLFFISAYFALALAAAYVLAGALRAVPSLNGPLGALILTGALVGPAIAVNFEDCDYSNYRLLSDHGRALIESVDTDAVLFPSSDHNTFPLLYFRYVEGRRGDVLIADRYGYIEDEVVTAAPFATAIPPDGRRSKSFRTAVEDWISSTWTRPIYFSHKRTLPSEMARVMVSEGLWYRVRPRGTAEGELEQADAAAWRTVGDLDPEQRSVPYDYSARVVLADQGFAMARRMLARGRIEDGERACEVAAQHVPESKEALNNLGSVLAEHGRYPLSRRMFERAWRLDRGYKVARRNLGLVLKAEGLTEDAWNHFVELHRSDNNDVVAARELGEIARSRKQWPSAAFFLEQYGRMSEDSRALRDAGLIALYELRDVARARRLLKESLKHDGSQTDIRDLVASLPDAGMDPATMTRGASAEARTSARKSGDVPRPTIIDPTRRADPMGRVPNPAVPAMKEGRTP